MSDWLWVENPDYVQRRPQKLEADCHDRSPFITIHCHCDFDNHLHESSIVEVPPDAGIASHCHGCGELMTFEPGWFHFAFEDLRRRGWLEETSTTGPFRCPLCGRVSHHPDDLANRYCSCCGSADGTLIKACPHRQ